MTRQSQTSTVYQSSILPTHPSLTFIKSAFSFAMFFIAVWLSIYSQNAWAQTTWDTWTTGELTLSDNITIDGSTHSTRTVSGTATLNGNNKYIDGSNTYRAISANGATISLNGVTFQNCYREREGSSEEKAKENGGAIQNWTGTVNITGGNNTFQNNKVIGGGGGAISCANLYIKDGNNTFCYGESRHGSAVYSRLYVEIQGGTNSFTYNNTVEPGTIFSNGNIKISGGNNTFDHNTSGWGTVLRANTDSGSGGNVTISGGTNTFTNNTANNGNGGVLYGNTEVLISGGENEFSGNTASSQGGAIYSSGLIKITGASNCTFQNNSTTSSQGGAICANSSDGITIDSTGIIVFGGEKEVDGKKVSLGNTSGWNGGAIWSKGPVNISCKNISFMNN